MIVVSDVLADVQMRLPSTNVLTDAQLTSIINSKITAIGSADSLYAEVVCKSLQESAEINKAKSIGENRLRGRKIENILEESYNSRGLDKSWDEYIKQLPTLCARLGYTGLDAIYGGYIVVNTDGGSATVDDERFINVNVTTSGSSTTNLTLPL